jgi:hypothetical protein
MEAYRAEIRRQLAALPRLQKRAIEQVLAELETARATILAELLTELSDSRRTARTRLLAEVERQITAWSKGAAQIASIAAGAAWEAGMQMVSAPLAAGGLNVTVGSRINPRALASVQQLLTDRISGAGREAIGRINTVISQTLIGTTAQADAISQVSDILGAPRRRAQTIIYTEVGRAHAMATHAAMIEAAPQVPGLRKRWLKSGKIHPRVDHVRAHNQIVLAAEPFMVAGERLMYPRDPNGSAANTINCGCMSIPVVNGSTLGASTVRIDRGTGEMTLERRQELTPAEIAIGATVDQARDAGLIVVTGRSI